MDDTGLKWECVAPSSPWKVRAMPRGGVLDGYFYVIAGRAGATTIHSDTWRSANGIAWERMSTKAGWGKRAYPEVDVVGGDLVLTGGQSLARFYNDVWRSSDQGRTWTQACASAPWERRAGHHSIVIDGSIYLFAGGRNSWRRIFYPELWVSHDAGETWDLRAELPLDMGRAGMQVVEVDGVIYFMGGDHDRPVFRPNWEGRRNDVWASPDLGKTWDMIGHAPWEPRTGQQCIGYKGRIICIGGHINDGHRTRQGLAHDMWIWNPSDPVEQWHLVTDDVWGAGSDPARQGKSDFLLEILDDQLWTFGGDREVASPWPQDNDVWRFDLTRLQ
ncbi:MAG: hypothetical protein ACR2N2_05570 [Acidimicrobiia bacterium]